MQRASLLLILLTCSLTGCGTISNLNEQDQPLIGLHRDVSVYGGVRNDIRWFWQNYPCWIIDLPFSAVGDTVTLPLVLYQQNNSTPAVPESQASTPARINSP